MARYWDWGLKSSLGATETCGCVVVPRDDLCLQKMTCGMLRGRLELKFSGEGDGVEVEALLRAVLRLSSEQLLSSDILL